MSFSDFGYMVQSFLIWSLLPMKWFLLQMTFCFCLKWRAAKPLGIYVAVFEAGFLCIFAFLTKMSMSDILDIYGLNMIYYDCIGAVEGSLIAWLVYAAYNIIKSVRKKTNNKKVGDTA